MHLGSLLRAEELGARAKIRGFLMPWCSRLRLKTYDVRRLLPR